jgi:hypothetical protein
MLLAGAFVVEFLSDGALRPLSVLGPAAQRRALAVPPLPPPPAGGTGAAPAADAGRAAAARVQGAWADSEEAPPVSADRYVGRRIRRGPPLVLVHGVTPDGKNDARAVRAAMQLARAGFEVAVPTVPGLVAGRLRPGDVEPVVRAIAAVTAPDRPAVVLGVSVGAGPALLAAADARVRDRVSTVLSLGGYASAPDLVRFFLTGEHAFGGIRGRVRHDPALVREFVLANADLVDAGTARALVSGDRSAVGAALEALPVEVQALLDALSPVHVVHDIRARIVLVHDRADPAVPYTESLRLAAAHPAGTQVILVDLLDHVEARGLPGAARHAGDLARVWALLYRLLAG